MPRHPSSYNWRTDPQYKLSETNPNKMMRPSTQALLAKIRSMKIMQEPGMANLVIYDLAHWFLYRNKEVVLLGKAASDLMHMWTSLVQNGDGKPAYIFGQPENHEERVEEGDAGDSPQEFDLKQFLIDNKGAMKDIVWDHYPTMRGLGVECSCGRLYAHPEAWADHVRVRISRALLNEFPQIGDKNGSADPV